MAPISLFVTLHYAGKVCQWQQCSYWVRS